MPDVFTTNYATRVNQGVKVTVKEGKDGDLLLPGVVYICKGGNHTTVIQKNKILYLKVFNDPYITPAPSIDTLFNSGYDLEGVDINAVVLTGMGSDGAKGIKKLHDKGFLTIGQDSKSSVVYGIPKSSFEIGGLSISLPLSEIMKNLLAYRSNKKTKEKQ
jgi:two-component system chemotaxis response regulator CheB